MSKKRRKREDPTIKKYIVEDNNSAIINYGNIWCENKIKKLIKSLRTYNRRAYKQYFFDFIPNIREAVSNGIIKDGSYEYNLYTDNMFKKIHGQIKVYYTVIGREVTIDNISPTDLLNEGADRMLEVYKGVIIASPRDKFKVDLYLNIKKGE